MLDAVEPVVVARGHVAVVLEQQTDDIIATLGNRVVQGSIAVRILDTRMCAFRQQLLAHAEMTFADTCTMT